MSIPDEQLEAYIQLVSEMHGVIVNRNTAKKELTQLLQFIALTYLPKDVQHILADALQWGYTESATLRETSRNTCFNQNCGEQKGVMGL